MNKLQLRDHEVTLFLKSISRPSAMIATLLASVWVQNDREDERQTEYLSSDMQHAMKAVQAHREVENAPRNLSGMDFVNAIVEANTLTKKLARLFQTARLETEIVIEVRDPLFRGSNALDIALKELNLKSGLSVTVVAAQEVA